MFRERIRENYDRLSKSQKRIADFLMTSQREAAFMTASRLATVLDVDVATITRFAQRLDYPGYPELLDEVRAVVQQEMNAGVHPVEGGTEAGRLFVQALTLARENIERTLTNISLDAVEKAVDALGSARKVYIIGQLTTSLLAEQLAFHLQVLGVDAVVISGDEVRVALSIRNLEATDAVVGFGFSSYAADVAGVMRLARERGAKTIAISGSDVSPVARVAEITLICAAAAPLHLPSEVAADAVIESLAHALAAHRMEIFQKNLVAFNDAYQH
jgi:DNA-binding MurR/RpiR family transcriptional regulator